MFVPSNSDSIIDLTGQWVFANSTSIGNKKRILLLIYMGSIHSGLQAFTVFAHCFCTKMSESDAPSSSAPPSVQEYRCVICLGDIDPQVLQLPTASSEYYHSRCGHITHSLCLQASVRSGNYNCPLCRQPLGDISVELETVEKRLHRFMKMLKSGLAPAAVRQRMVVDGLPLAMIDAFFTGGASRALGNGEEDSKAETPEERERKVQAWFDKYRKMLDRGMPEGAVRQKMQTTQRELTEEEIDRFFAALS